MTTGIFLNVAQVFRVLSYRDTLNSLTRCVRQQEHVVHAECGVPTGGTLLSRLLYGCLTRGTFLATYSQIILLNLHECK